MSDVNLNFEIVPVQANLTVTTNDLNFTPETINMTFYTGVVNLTAAAGPNGSLQYNNANTISGISSITSTGTVTTVNNIGNLKIGGGTANYVMTTDGSGNISWQASATGYPPGGSNTYIQYNNAGSFDGSANFNYNSTTDTVSINNNNVTGNLAIQRAQEKVTNTTFTTAISFDVLTQSIINYISNCTNNFTLNFRGSGTTSFNSCLLTNQCMTFALSVSNGATAYYLTTVSIDGVAQAVNWLGGAPIAGFVNSKEIYNFNIIKTAASTYTVFGSRGVYS